jgi:rRNA maturation RNase YbeY
MIVIESKMDLPFPTNSLKEWVISCLKSKGVILGKIFINIIDKDQMLNINKDFLNHDSHTDVITFNYSLDNKIEGEIFISEFMLLQNAEKLFQSTDNELLRLISHGLLHLLGYKDNDKAKKKEMSKEEDFFIKLFHVKPS